MSAQVKSARDATATPARPEWAKARRIVVKIGSALLVDRATGALKPRGSSR